MFVQTDHKPLGVCYEEESAKCTEEGEKNAVVVMEV